MYAMKIKLFVALISIIFVILIATLYAQFSRNSTIQSNNTNTSSSQNSSTSQDSNYIVYETEVENAQQCTNLEKFDEKKSVCYFECKNELECKEIETKIDNELNSWIAESSVKPQKTDEVSQNEGSLATYSVNQGEKIELVSGEDLEKYKKIWGEISELSEDKFTDDFIEKFIIYDNITDDTLASVIDSDSNGKWEISVNYTNHINSTIREQKSTLIHELAHIISLNTTQLSTSIPKEECNFHYLDEGCTNENSYINYFVSDFWKGLLGTKPEYDENLFVSEYATTNEVEDFAESFTHFVLSSNFSENTQKEKKIKFFSKFSPLLEIREKMRQSLAKEIVDSK